MLLHSLQMATTLRISGGRRRFLSSCCCCCYYYYATASVVATPCAPLSRPIGPIATPAFMLSPHTINNDVKRRYFGKKSRNFQHKFLKVVSTKGQRDGDGLEDVDKDGTAGSIPLDADDEIDDDEDIKKTTFDWINNVVIRLNLCPFAEKPLRDNKLKVSVVRGSDDEYVAAAVVYELISRSDEKHDGTTVVVAPDFYPDDFERYMDLVQYLEDDVMEEHNLHGLVQIAPFHPKFVFSGSGDGVDNYTNRSPYPMFHILRENEVGIAVDKLSGDASKVWKRNVNLLERMEKLYGREGVKKIMKGERLDGMRDLLRDIRGYSENQP